MASRIARELRDAIAADANRRGVAFTKGDWELLALDIDLNAQGIAFVANKLRSRVSTASGTT